MSLSIVFLRMGMNLDFNLIISKTIMLNTIPFLFEILAYILILPYFIVNLNYYGAFLIGVI